MNELSPEAKALVSLSRKAGAPDGEDLKRVRGKLLAAAESERILKLTAERWAPPAKKPISRLGRMMPWAAALLLIVAAGGYATVQYTAKAQLEERREARNRELLAEARVNAEARQWAEVRRLAEQVRSSTPELEPEEIDRLLARANAELAKNSRPLAPETSLANTEAAKAFEQALAQCVSALERAVPERWLETERLCKQAADLEPSNRTARDALAAVTREADCDAALELGLAAITADQVEGGLELLARVTSECPKTQLVYVQTREPVLNRARRHAAARCELLAKAERWAEALQQCERYARLACGGLSAAVVEQSKQDALGPRAPKDASAAADPVLTWFFKARAKVAPKAGAWSCDSVSTVPAPMAALASRAPPREKLAWRYTNPAELEAVMNYFEGRFPEAVSSLQDRSGRPISPDLLVLITNAISNYQTGLMELANDKPEKAQEPMAKALKLDARILLRNDTELPEDAVQKGLASLRSFVRQGIEESMPKKAYEQGKAFADRKDFKQACSLWKLGLAFSRANNELLKASYFCTQKAQRMLDQARTCDELEAVREYAVDGDRIGEAVDQRSADLRCPRPSPGNRTVDPADFMMKATAPTEAPEVLAIRERFRRNDVAGALNAALECSAHTPDCRGLVGQLNDYSARNHALDSLKDDDLLAFYELDKTIGGGTPSEQSKPIRTRLAASFSMKASSAKLAGQWSRAIDLARKVLSADPTHAGANTIISEARSAAKDQYLRAYQLRDTSPDEAIRLFKDVLLMTPKDDDYHQRAEVRLNELNAK